MATDVDICNLALGRLGDEATVSSIDPADNSAQAKYCAKFYLLSLNSVLDEYPWSFSIKTISAALLENTQTLWAYCYAVPSDCNKIVGIYDPAAVGDVKTEQEYTVELNETGAPVIYTNQITAVLKYTAFISDTSTFSPSFIEALVWKLASNLAGVIIKGDVGVSASLKTFQAYQAALSTAKKADSQSRFVKPNYIPSGIEARA